MKEIKFRAWDGTENRFYPWADDLLVSCSGKIFEVDYDDVEDGTPIECFNCFELEQFTGLRDKNGKEIYEGDVLSYYSGMVPKGTNPIVKQVVKWKQHQYVGINNWGMAEVIGNIHENPELLND